MENANLKMTQQEVMNILERADRPLAAKEIIKELQKEREINEKNVFVIISLLLKHKEIKYKEISRNLAKKMYKDGIKRRMRLYYV